MWTQYILEFFFSFSNRTDTRICTRPKGHVLKVETCVAYSGINIPNWTIWGNKVDIYNNQGREKKCRKQTFSRHSTDLLLKICPWHFFFAFFFFLSFSFLRFVFIIDKHFLYDYYLFTEHDDRTIERHRKKMFIRFSPFFLNSSTKRHSEPLEGGSKWFYNIWNLYLLSYHSR